MGIYSKLKIWFLHYVNLNSLSKNPSEAEAQNLQTLRQSRPQLQVRNSRTRLWPGIQWRPQRALECHGL